MGKIKGDDMFEARIYDLQEVLGSDVTLEGVEDMNQAYAMVLSGGDGEATAIFLTCDEDIETMAATLEKVAMEIRTLKKDSMMLH